MAPGRARVRIAGGSFWVRGAAGPPQSLAVEILAQAAAELLASAGGVAPGFLAGVEEARWTGEPLRAGDEVEVAVEVEARLGRAVKLRGGLERSGAEIFSARLLVREA
ncbi:MAG TPA: hypothetical protein VLF66_07025 [Thermoanaerobaculia bacterium]|nr:hypothetical protein [Thermoanaerobaculia bacterium]